MAKEISLDSITPREKTLLINAIMPAKPMDPGESRRLGTFALLLWLTAQNHGPIDEYDVFAAAREPPGNIPSVFRTVLDGWLDYTIRDVIAATHEAVFEAVMREVDAASARRGAPALAAEVVSAIVGATDDHNDALRQTGLLAKGETVRRLSFSQMLERIDGACGDDVTVSNGLRRWRRGLSETEVYNAALDAGHAAAALLPVACALAARRISSMPAGTPARKVTLIGGFFQIGLAAVVLPKIEEFCHEKRSYLDVMAELVTRTVQQHGLSRACFHRSVLNPDLPSPSRAQGGDYAAHYDSDR